MNNLLSGNIPLYPPSDYSLPGPIGSTPPANAPNQLSRILTSAIGILTVVAAIYFLIKVIIGAIGIISSGGDKGKLTEARSSIVNGLIGIIIVVTSTIFVNFVFRLLGIGNILILDVIIESLAP